MPDKILIQWITTYSSITACREKKELFKPLHSPFVGMYVCGPTVYSETHLGHARPAITFDLLYRYLMHMGYKVRYIRNITDVGHLENDAMRERIKLKKRPVLNILNQWRLSRNT